MAVAAAVAVIGDELMADTYYNHWFENRHDHQGDASMSVEVGAKAPDFTLPNQDREPVSLSEQLKSGPVVLAFFPAAFSGTCQKEMCTFRDSASTLNSVKAKVLGISVDTFFALKAWGDENKLNFPLLSDFNKDVIAKYGVVNPDMIGLKNIAKRSVFVIDKGGVVRHREVLEDARNEPNYEKITQTLASL
jgi:peroxiredoxin